MSGMSLPPLLRTDTLERPENQDVNTDILRPVNFSQTGCKFVFQRKGILDSNSQLSLQQTVEDSTHAGSDTGAVCPTSTGALAMIQRAWLTIGGRRISNLDDCADWNTWKRLHYTDEYLKGIVIPKQGGNDTFGGSTQRGILADSTTSINARGFVAPYGVLGRESSEFSISDVGDATFGTQVDTGSDTRDIARNRLTPFASSTPTFAVGLSQIIPLLATGLQLPLFAIKEEVAINIEWAKNTVNYRFTASELAPDTIGAVSAADMTSTMIQDGVFIMADYLYYPDRMADVEDEIMTKGGYDVPYDEILTTTSYTTYAAGQITNNYQIVAGGRKVKSIVVQKSVEPTVATPLVGANNLGVHNSTAFKNGVSPQLNIDAKNWYSQPITNQSLLKCCADSVESVPLSLNSYRMSFKGLPFGVAPAPVLPSGLSDRKVNNFSQAPESGSQAWVGIKLENQFGQGVRVSNLPMIYSESINVDTDDIIVPKNNRKVKIFVKTQQLLNIAGGLVEMIE
tara:strand:+ start:770 stop:2302 length:1533 start_codon:yes stop_codon:yes gene_type:complete